ncbi:MAG: YceI family protein [Acidimicrobiia bacterium]
MRKWIIVLAVIVLAGGGFYIWFSGSTSEPSTPLTAPTVSQAVASAQTYSIESASSKATFTIDEVLRGSPATVDGSTDQVAGEVSLDPSDTSTMQIGTININARTFVTDESQRNNSIRRFILSTDQYEFIEFTPTKIEGLPASVDVGSQFSFTVTGDLTVKDATNPVTFDVTATLVSDTQIEGTATAKITRSEFGVTIPSVPFVADVSDDVALELDFVAKAG